MNVELGGETKVQDSSVLHPASSLKLMKQIQMRSMLLEYLEVKKTKKKKNNENCVLLEVCLKKKCLNSLT